MLAYLWQSWIARVHDGPANLDNLGAVLGHIDPVLIASRGNVYDHILLELLLGAGRSCILYHSALISLVLLVGLRDSGATLTCLA